MISEGYVPPEQPSSAKTDGAEPPAPFRYFPPYARAREDGPAPDALLPEISDLAERARDYARAATAESTRRAYQRGWRSFEAWCAARGLDPLPADPTTVGLYLADDASRHSIASLRLALVAMKQVHRFAGHRLDTSHPAIRDVFAGIRRTHGVAPRKVEAATTEILRDAVRQLAQRDTSAAWRDRAVLLLGFAAALRRSEVAALRLADIAFSRDGLVLTLRRSKTDQEAAGHEIGIPQGQHELTCPVRTLRAWIERARIIEPEAPVFVSVLKGDRVTSTRLSDRDVARIVKRAVGAAGYDVQRFSGHSLRAGFATSAARAGVPEAAIMVQTRHRSLPVLREYIRRGSLFTDNAAARVGL
jgi:integrase